MTTFVNAPSKTTLAIKELQSVVSSGSTSGANPTATASNTAVNGVATTFMRSDAAPAVQVTSSLVFGLAKVDGSTITASSGVISSVGASGANPTATASDTAVNGVAATFMRSDAAPAVQKTSSSQFGVAKVDGTTITASGGVISGATGVLSGYIYGLTLSNDGVTPNSVLDISSGLAADSTGTVNITLGAFTKSTGGSWVAGTGNNGMGTGLTIANSTWYHVFAIINSGNADVYFDTSVTAANKPASTTAFRRIGSFKTDGSAHIISFLQIGQNFQWVSPPTDVNGVTTSTSVATTCTLSVPPGVNVEAVLEVELAGLSTPQSQLILYTPGITGTNGIGLLVPPNSQTGAIQAKIYTDTSQTIKAISHNNTGTLFIATTGWSDPLGAGVITTLPIVPAGNALPPSGRLTLTSGTPILTSTVSGATTVYFTPYKGNTVPVWNGSQFATTSFSELSQATTDTTKSPAAVAASSVYDIFVWSDSGTIRATRGPVWTSSTSRGTGAGTSELQLTNGVYNNKNSITNGPAAGFGTYVGSIASNGSSTIDFILGGSASGGTAGVLNVWNYYNRALVRAFSQDTAASYTYTSINIRQANASAGNQVTFLSGLAEDSISATAWVSMQTVATAGAFGVSGLAGLDSTTTGAQNVGYAFVLAVTAAQYQTRGSVSTVFPPQIGSHFIARMEESDGSHASNFNVVSNDLLSFAMPM